MSKKQTLRPFHLAIPVDDLEQARSFYVEILGCGVGRSDEQWMDFDFQGHQLVCHLDQRKARSADALHNLVDGHGVPVPHFGLVLEMDAWEHMRDRLQSSGMQFIIAPTVRFRGQMGEQATIFFRDPAGNNLEIKAFASLDRLFAS
jgi:extradiol dioxygenase family protein